MHKIELSVSKKFPKVFDYTSVDCLITESADFEKVYAARLWMNAEIKVQLAKKIAAKKADDEAKKSGQEKKSIGKTADTPKPNHLRTPSFENLKLYFSQGGESIAFALPKESFSTFELFTAMRKAFSGFFGEGAKHKIVLDLSSIGAKRESLVLQIVEAFGHISESCDWKPMGFGKKAEAKTKFKDLHIEIVSGLNKVKIEKAFQLGRVKGRATNHVRTLAEMPPNELDPAGYRKHIEKFCKNHKFKYEFFNKEKLTQMGANAFLAVVRADPNTQGGIAKISYKPIGKTTAKSKGLVALVGKGLCFDTGGYNVKTGDFMHGMHGDMTGSAVVLACMQAIEELAMPFEVTGYLAIAENLISPTAFKPNEVIVALNGSSIEMVDTDAEGRMVLSDTLTMASREEPDLMIDYATLTGSIIRALDRRRSGVYTNSEKHLPLLQAAGDVSGERVWGFTIGRDYFDNLKSEHADIKQCNPKWNADHIYAATFLSTFVEKNVPWFHVDLAASEHSGGLGLVGSDSTGYGVGLTLEFLNRFFKN